MTKTSGKTSKQKEAKNVDSWEKAGQKTRSVLTALLTVIMIPFYVVYRLFFKMPDTYSPGLGIFRALVTFAIACWLTSEQGIAMEHMASQYLSSFMDISLAKLVVKSFGLICVVIGLISLLIIGGMHSTMAYTGRASDLNRYENHPYPNIDRALHNFDAKLGFGTIDGFVSLAKKVMK